MPSNWSTFKGNFWGYGKPLSTYTGENIAIFMGGLDLNGGNINNTSIYNYTTNIALEGAALTYMANSSGAVSNGTIAVCAGGEYRPDTNDSLSYYLSTSNNYTYSSNTVVAGNSLPFTMGYVSAAGNDTTGILGWSSPNYSSSSIYTFSSNTYTAGANLTYGNSSVAATGNATIAVFGGGSDILPPTNIYAYSSNVFTAASSLLYASQNIAAAGTPYLGIFSSGAWSSGATPTYSSNTSQYTYSNLTVNVGGNLSYEAEYLGAASNSTVGVFGGGGSAYGFNNTSLYNFNLNSSTAGGNLSHRTYAVSATGPNPGVNCGNIIITIIPGISTPSIINPSNGSINNATSFTVSASAFTVAGGTDTQISASWQLATDAGFTNIVSQSINDTVNLTSWAVSGLSYSTTYYLRVQYTGAAYGVSAWSATDSFSTAAPIAPGIALFGGGYSSSGYLHTTSIYTYSSNTAVAGGNLSYTVSNLAAAGNSSIGVFGGGENNGVYLNTTSIYTYSSNTAVAGGNLSYTVSNLAAAGNSSVGVFGGGNNGNTNTPTTADVPTTLVYTYSSNSVVAGGNLSYRASRLVAAGNSNIALFGGGYYYDGGTVTQVTNSTSIYTYSSNTAVSGASLTNIAAGYTTVIGENLVAAGNSTVGVFKNISGQTVLYAYSSNSEVAGGNISSLVDSAASNSTVGVFGGGVDSNYNFYSSTSIYTYSSNTVVAGGNLSYSSDSAAACGPNPGVNY